MKKTTLISLCFGLLFGLFKLGANAQEVLVTRGLGTASGSSGTNTGDQTETCSAGQFVSTLAATTTSTCSGALEDGGVLNSAAFAAAIVADSPLLRYDDGGTVGISIPYASAIRGSGALNCTDGTCRLDAGLVCTSTEASTFTGSLAASNLSGTNTGDQTKTCGAGLFITTLAATTTSACSGPGTDGGVLDTVLLVADSPLTVYDDGGTLGVSCAAASASSSGCVQIVGGLAVLDAGVRLTSTLAAGTITLSGGTGTATVPTGARCVCSDSTAVAAVRCAVSSTTLTATGTTTDVIVYHCF